LVIETVSTLYSSLYFHEHCTCSYFYT